MKFNGRFYGNSQIANYCLGCLMSKHRSMRPQDIVILLKIVAIGEKEWKFKDLS